MAGGTAIGAEGRRQRRRREISAAKIFIGNARHGNENWQKRSLLACNLSMIILCRAWRKWRRNGVAKNSEDNNQWRPVWRMAA